MTWGQHPNSMKNLKMITPDLAREYQKKGVASRLLNTELQKQFKINAKAFLKVKEDLPDLSALDVLRMAMHVALQEDNFEDAARYASMVAEYEQPKLQRIDQTNTNKVENLTDEDLQKIIAEEKLKG